MRVKKTYLQLFLVILFIIVIAFIGFKFWNSIVLTNLGQVSTFSLALILGLAFFAGLITFFGPCGLALLPAYISFFLGTGKDNTKVGIGKALSTGASVTLGIIFFFVIIGVVFSFLGTFIGPYIKYLQYLFAVALVFLGIMMLRNVTLNIGASRIFRGKFFSEKIKGSAGPFVFGAGYGLASVGCTFPVIAALILFPLTAGNFVQGISAFLAYSIALGIMVTFMTFIIYKSRHDILEKILKSTEKVKKLGGILMILAGIGLILYYAFFGMVIG